VISLPEILIEDAIEAGLAEIEGNPAFYVDTIFQNFAEDRRESILDWIQDDGFNEAKFAVRQGFPSFPPRPGIYIVLAGATEQITSVGNLLEVMEATDSYPRTFIYGAFFQTSVRVLVITPSADWTIYAQAMVAWALLSRRDELAEAGLNQQQLSMQDMAPVKEMQPDIVFSRDLTLSCLVKHLWIKVFDQEISDVRANLEGDDYPGG
jgi:hypothetical protein